MNNPNADRPERRTALARELASYHVDMAALTETQGVLMAEELNMHFSSVFTREDTIVRYLYQNKVRGIRGGKVGAVSGNHRSSS